MSRKRKEREPSAVKVLKHLPVDQWPQADRTAFQAVFADGDLFDDDRPAGAHLAEGTKRHITMSWRRWLGFLNREYPDALGLAPCARITPERVAGFITHLANDVRRTTVASELDQLHYAARLLMPSWDWSWLAGVKKRIHADAVPINRFEQLQAPWDTLDLGLRLMAEAATLPADPHYLAQIQYRDGLVIAILSLWPIRRRSIGSFSIDRHIERFPGQMHFRLFAEDTKAGRTEVFAVPDVIRRHVEHYLTVIRPSLMRFAAHDAFWVSARGSRLSDAGIYQIVRKHTQAAFGIPMGLHDFRRAAGTWLAIHAPHKIGILPGVLQHAGPDTSDRHYKMAGSSAAAKRYAVTLTELKKRSSIKKQN